MSQDTTARNVGVSVATSDTLVAAYNSGRKELTICNDGANIVYLSLGTAAAVAASGIRLAAGASYTTNKWQGMVRGIALTGATNVTVSEI